MPANKQANKKNGKNKRQARNSGVTIPLYSTTGAPARREVLAYHSTANLTEPAAYTGTYYTFRLNSIYDPDFTGSGSTYLGYASKSNLYGAYRVISTRVRVRFFGNTAGAAVVGLMFGANSTFASNANTWPIQPNSCNKILCGNTGTSHSIVTFDLTHKMSKLSGVTEREFLTDMDFRSDFGSSPLKAVYVTLWIQGQSAASASINYELTLSSLVEFSKPLQSLV